MTAARGCGTSRGMRDVPVSPFVRAAIALALALLPLACSKPEPPTLAPDRVRITGLSTSRIDLDVTLRATNPNSLDLVARNLTAHLVLDGQFDVGTVDIPFKTVLPAGQTTSLDVPLSVKIVDIAPLAQLALTKAKIPCSVDGTVGVGGDLLHVDIPYRLTGTVDRDQVLRAAAAGIPGLGGFR